MRHVWNGMIIGAFTGAVAGLGLELVEGGGRKAADLADQGASAVREQIPHVIEQVRGVAATASDKAPDVAESGRQAVSTIRRAVADHTKE
jgi:hypothetical protein